METYGMKFTLKNYINLGNKGFTFMELMIAMTVAALTILFFVTTQTKFQLNAETAYERKVATQDAHRFLEQMRITAQTGTFPANVSTTAFPAGTVAGYTSMPSSAETMTVAYASASADPLDVTVTVSWTGYNQRTSSQTVRTMVTKR